jgi:hypothetical protein
MSHAKHLFDECPICLTQFHRRWLRPGVKQTYCSKKCRYDAGRFPSHCKTCGKPFKSHKLRLHPDYCSLACIERSPCQFCGRLITGRVKFQGGERRYCSRECAAFANLTFKSQTKYKVLAFLGCLQRHGKIVCERCGYDDVTGLVAHHRAGRAAGLCNDLEVLCGTCHVQEHWKNSKANAQNVQIARRIYELAMPDVLRQLLKERGCSRPRLTFIDDAFGRPDSFIAYG